MWKLIADEEKLSPRKLYKRIGDLREFIRLSEDVADKYLLERASAELDSVEERAKLGAEFTVAALVGGTGSGKSTLFNTLTGLEFADAGAIRPTTEKATACTWRAKAEGLLDYLNVLPGRRVEHDSILTPVSDELEGLILLDLPDYDSVKFTNSLTVSRLMPLLDVLIWVVDPQKYADQLLHREYLENLQGRSRQMIVLMNHIDTVVPTQVPILMADLRRLLDADGLENVPAYAVSALRDTGLEPVREHLRLAVNTPSTNLVTAASQVDEVTRLLAGTIADMPCGMDEILHQKSDLVERILSASGVPTVLEQISRSGKIFSTVALAAPLSPAPTLCAAIYDSWLAQMKVGLPAHWESLLMESVSGAERLRRNLNNIYDSVALPVFSRKWLRVFFGLIFLLLFMFGVGVFVLLDFLPLTTRILLLSVELVIGLCAVVYAKLWLRKDARIAAQKYADKLRKEIAQLVQTDLIDSPFVVIKRYENACELLRK